MSAPNTLRSRTPNVKSYRFPLGGPTPDMSANYQNPLSA